jgi:hypothetical protein
MWQVVHTYNPLYHHIIISQLYNILAIMNKTTKIKKNVTSNKWHTHYHTVTPKRPKILKISKLLNSLMNKYFCNCDTESMWHCTMWRIDWHLKDGWRHGMDTYLLNIKYKWNVFKQLLHLMVSGWQVTASFRLLCVLMTRKDWTFFCSSALLTNHKKTRFKATIFPSTLLK